MEQSARFHLPDFTQHLRLNLMLMTMMQQKPEYFRENVEIASVYGCFPPSVWNGGRPQGGFKCTDEYIKNVLHAFNSQGIPIRFTFTNPLITEEHLDDPFCNHVMQLADNGLNEVIIFSEILEQYIREKYPSYKLTSSTCKRLTDPEKVAAELEKDYYVVVLDYDLNNKFEILDALPHHEKIEMLATSPCIPNCPRRSKEYEVCGRQQITYNMHLKQHPGKPFNMQDYSTETMHQFDNCPAMHRTPFDIRSLPHHISPDLIHDWYVPHGFRQFKLSGRGGSKLAIIENYMYYFIKPECRDEARFMLLHNLDRNGAVKIDSMI